eukprot:11975012-Alexandrium_andersonii.AAC.1
MPWSEGSAPGTGPGPRNRSSASLRVLARDTGVGQKAGLRFAMLQAMIELCVARGHKCTRR